MTQEAPRTPAPVAAADRESGPGRTSDAGLTPDAVHSSEAVRSSEAEHQERLGEGLTMALYVGVSLLAVLVVTPREAGGGRVERAVTIGLTSLSLILAHQLAFRLSSRLVQRGRLTQANLELLAAQLLGGAAVTVVAVVPVLLIDAPGGVLACELLLLGFVAVVGYRAARSVPVGRASALGYVTLVVVLTLAVLALKTAVKH